MAKVFKKIMCPVDFDRASSEALDFACKLAELHDGTIYLLHVVSTPRFDDILLEPPHPIITEAIARKELEKVAGQLLGSKVPYQLVIRSGDPAAMIVAAAEEVGVDLIVMATHSGREMTRLIFGSVAERVSHEAKRSVLNIRPHPLRDSNRLT